MVNVPPNITGKRWMRASLFVGGWFFAMAIMWFATDPNQDEARYGGAVIGQILFPLGALIWFCIDKFGKNIFINPVLKSIWHIILAIILYVLLGAISLAVLFNVH